MNAFLITLLLILVVGLAITSLALNQWTDGWLWPILHVCLFVVSIVFMHINLYK